METVEKEEKNEKTALICKRSAPFLHRIGRTTVPSVQSLHRNQIAVIFDFSRQDIIVKFCFSQYNRWLSAVFPSMRATLLFTARISLRSGMEDGPSRQ